MQFPRLYSPELIRMSVLKVCVIPPEHATAGEIIFFLMLMLVSRVFYLQRLRGNLKTNLNSARLGRQ